METSRWVGNLEGDGSHNTSSEVELMETDGLRSYSATAYRHNTSSEVELMETGKKV